MDVKPKIDMLCDVCTAPVKVSVIDAELAAKMSIVPEQERSTILNRRVLCEPCTRNAVMRVHEARNTEDMD